MVVGSNPVAVTSPSDFAPASSKEFLDIQATIECGFTLKRVRDMIKTYSHATGCLLDYDYFKKNYQLIAVDLSKQTELDADPRAIQQIEFIGMLKTRSNVFTILEKSKETVLEFYKGTAKVM